MGVATPVQPDYPSSSGSQYPADIDAATAVLAAVGFQFAPHEETTPAMTVRIEAGELYDGSTRTTVAAQSTGAITAPTTDPRNDIVWLDRTTGAVGVATGVEAPTPSDPALPANAVPVARVRLQTSTAAITNDLIDDLRPAGMPMGLGSAAFLTAGAATGNVPQLVDVGGSPGLPAVDGSQLTGISTGAASDIRALALRVAELEGDRINMIDGIADPFVDETDIDTGASSNQNFIASGGYYEPTGLQSQIPQGTGTAIGDMTQNGGLAAAFDGTTSQNEAASARKAGGTTVAYIGKDWGASNDKTITGFRVYGSSAKGFYSDNDTATVTCKLQGSTDNFSSSIVDLGSTTAVTDAAGLMIEKLSGLTTSTAYHYHRVELEFSATAGGKICAECQFFEGSGTPDNMILQSVAFTAAAQPDEARLHIQAKPIDSMTLNTDLIGKASRDGTTWATATLVEVGELVDGTKLYEDPPIDVSGQPAGTSMKYRVETANNKNVQLHAAVEQWA